MNRARTLALVTSRIPQNQAWNSKLIRLYLLHVTPRRVVRVISTEQVRIRSKRKDDVDLGHTALGNNITCISQKRNPRNSKGGATSTILKTNTTQHVKGRSCSELTSRESSKIKFYKGPEWTFYVISEHGYRLPVDQSVIQ